jgi:hypothetical protein
MVWRLPHIIIIFLLLPAFSSHANDSAESPVLQIGSRRELFVDRFLIDSMKDVRLQLNQPREEETVLRFDAGHEGPFAGYTTVIRDGDLFRMYYRGISQISRDGSEHERTCYAESRDGVTWTKPQLGLFEFNGSTANNIVLADVAPVTHNFCPLLDTNPDAPASERYKGVGGTGDELFAFVSADGLHWKRMQADPILSSADVSLRHRHLFDSQNLAFWSDSEQCYVCYFRLWDGIRRIARTTSPDFRNWSPAVLMRQMHDDGVTGPRPAPEEHLYTNQTTPYFRAPHLYFATAARFFPGRQVVNDEQAAALNVNPKYYKDTSDSVFMTSRGGDVYDRTFLEGFLKPGIGLGNWVSRANYPALNIVQTGPTEMSFYVNHHYAQPTAHLKRYSLRLDGFASLHADAAEGEFTTKPLIFSGSELQINFATSAGGSIRFELQDLSGKPIPGFALSDCQQLIGNEITRTVHWTSASDLSKLAGRSVRLRCVLRDADLFALQFLAEESTDPT